MKRFITIACGASLLLTASLVSARLYISPTSPHAGPLTGPYDRMLLAGADPESLYGETFKQEEEIEPAGEPKIYKYKIDGAHVEIFGMNEGEEKRPLKEEDVDALENDAREIEGEDSIVINGSSASDRADEKPEILVEMSDADSKALGFGKDIPLSMAVKQIIPPEYKVHIDYGLGDKLVSWSGGEEWQKVLADALDDHSLAYHVNENDLIVGISYDAELARYMALPVPQVWHLKDVQSLRENLAEWSERAGWKLVWELDVDYPIEHQATFTGEFFKVFQVVIDRYKDFEVPLHAEFHTQNRVIEVTEAGYEQGAF